MALTHPKVGLVFLMIQTEALLRGSEGLEKQTPRKDTIWGTWTVERLSLLIFQLKQSPARTLLPVEEETFSLKPKMASVSPLRLSSPVGAERMEQCLW